MKGDGTVNNQLIINCESLGLTHKGHGQFTIGESEFDLSASGYEFEHIAKNIIKQL